MNYLPYLILTIASSLGVILVNAVVFFFLLKKDRQLDREKRALYEQTSAVLEKVQKDAEKIVTAGVEQVKETLSKTSSFSYATSAAIEERLNFALEKAIQQLESESHTLSKDYTAAASDLRSQYIAALRTAKQTLLDSEYLKEVVVKSLDAHMQKIQDQSIEALSAETKHLEEEYAQTIKDIEKEFLAKAQETVQSLKKIPEEELEDFRRILRDETISSQKFIEQKTLKAYDEALTEIQAYKAQKLAEIDAGIGSIIQQTLRKVFSRGITLDLQEKLIIESLEQAKRDQFFEGLKKQYESK